MALVGAQFVQAVQPVPVGSLQAFAGANAPTGWLLCDGTSYSTSLYPDLFSVLGYTYGGSGSNFNVPDLRGRMPVGAGNDGTTENNVARTRGSKGGDTRIGNHSHPYGSVTTSGGSVNAGGDIIWAVSGGNVVDKNGVGYLNTKAVGGGTGDNMPPFLVTNYIIKALPDVPRQGQALGTTPPIVTALPVNPQFGEVVTYAADATNGVYWSLQYDGGGTYPWKFLGGGALYDSSTTSFSTASTSWTSDTTYTGFTVPLAGDYLVTTTCVANNAAAFNWWLWRPDGCGYPTGDTAGIRVSQGNNGNYESG
ncbi:MAG: phage tail protein, partial [Steroidobacteraceae bacterium]